LIQRQHRSIPPQLAVVPQNDGAAVLHPGVRLETVLWLTATTEIEKSPTDVWALSLKADIG